MISRRKNKFVFKEKLTLLDVQILEKAIVSNCALYSEWILDFQNIETAPMGELLGLVCQVISKKHDGHHFKIVLPKKSSLSKEWQDKNILYLLGQTKMISKYQGISFYPAQQYTNSDEHFKIVNEIFKVILSGAEGIGRADYAALEWSINEVSDNVLVHSESPIGGILLVNKIDRSSGKINFIVADSGRGITDTLGKAFEGESEVSILDKAVREGITRDKRVGQGNGLFGSYEISHQGKGAFKALSNNALLSYEKGKLSISKTGSIYNGTIVEVTVDFSTKNLMASALKINGKQYEPVDFIGTSYEDEDEDNINFVVRDEARSYGTRFAAYPLKKRLLNIVGMTDSKIIVNFDNLPIISSSFADETLGKILLEVGETSFRSRFIVVCSNEQNNAIIQRSVNQRINDLQAGDLRKVA